MKHATRQHTLPDIAKMSSWRAISKVPKLLEPTKCTCVYVIMYVTKFHKLHYDILCSTNIAQGQQQKYVYL
jgi:hypothetical protein